MALIFFGILISESFDIQGFTQALPPNTSNFPYWGLSLNYLIYIFSPTPPQEFGDDIDVPFINCVFLSVHFGTDVNAPPGAVMQTPSEPSTQGPRDDHVYCLPGIFSNIEYSTSIISGET